ncbi:MAG: 3-dehydroquinate synthase [Chloroflexota bacterium]
MRKIFLYGPPGSGKSTVGKILAKKLDVEFLDVDTEIEVLNSMSIAGIVSEFGWQVFRDKESELIREICTHEDDKTLKYRHYGVIALGGGALLRAENRELCENSGSVILLYADYSALVSRISLDEKARPLLEGEEEEKLWSLLEDRRNHYDSFEMRVATSEPSPFIENISPDIISNEIQKKIGRYRVTSMGQGYDVIVQPGGLHELGNMLRERYLGGPIVIVSDMNISKIYADLVRRSCIAAGFSTQLVAIQPGENFKTLDTVSKLWQDFLNAGLDRKSTVIALGGGVVGDLAGFAASTYMRGCNWVTVPTSLLSMVDASMGGKTGFDLPEGKNLIGSFYSPRFVLADPEVLATLPDEEFRSGLAEVVKHGIISDPDLFELCSQGFEKIKLDITSIVARAMSVKVEIIEKDPYEKGLRAALNLGHTIGHAVELASNYHLRHGEAVSIGMVAEARLAERLGLSKPGSNISEIIKKSLHNIGLPTEIPPELSQTVIIEAMRKDKKKEKNFINFALPLDIGDVKINVALDDLEKVL